MNEEKDRLTPVVMQVAESAGILESRTGQKDDILNRKLSRAFHQPTAHVLVHDIAKIASEHDPIDLAYAVSRLPPFARIVVYENLPDLPSKVTFMINTGSNTRAAIFRQIDNQEIKRLVEKMPPDEAVDLFDAMTDRRMKRVLDLLQPRKSVAIRELLRHDRDTAGRLMTNEFFAFPMETKIGEVARSIRNNPGIDLTRRIFVTNEAGELVGYVPGRNLIINPHFLPLRQVMRPVLQKVTPESSRDEVVDIVERYKISALPVVNEDNLLKGVITYEDVVEAMEDIADETIASIAGTAEVISEHDPIFKRFMWRAPWLIVTLCAGLVNSTIMNQFNVQLWFVFVAPFVPLITGMSGNVGLQCSTILVRGMSTGEVTSGATGEAVLKEWVIGLLIGLVFGVGCGLIIYLLSQFGVNWGMQPVMISVMVSAGILGACMTAATLGTFLPFFFARLGIDPAVAAGPRDTFTR